ncbi:hypothetical protein JG688_00015618 [Phytophthora aleatoria]|uniref:DDE Tnp4 domain-containing protein n=1 Tax=Phytophthora aleatoria TaxID=2496075 RepID=A0A8J5LZE7_9STRA|nr:hypothetical protein JG688_00015618 [Phytophthora aleatoria]
MTASADSCSGIEALCVLLSRLAFPKRYYDMMTTFGHERAWLCRVFLHMIDHVHDTLENKCYMAENIVAARMNEYCNAIKKKGAPTGGIFGVPDGPKLSVCRPSSLSEGTGGENLQKHLYSGHKRCHCLNYKAVTAPDGMCIHFWGPMEGRLHDSTMLRESALLEYFNEHQDTFEITFLYGDPGYGVRKYLVSGLQQRKTIPILTTLEHLHR